ncbi:hypothetical protein SAMN05444506_103191 [Pseudomonas syringae]|nr:hypothetical protein ALQ58_200341 [Pseudomonas syringae pv. apii]SDY46908.1 hypothetical protein SAMN05444506_103191 [Pseudomonas syringae]
MKTTLRNCKHCASVMVCRTARKVFCCALCRVNHHNKLLLIHTVERLQNKEPHIWQHQQTSSMTVDTASQ